jgi:hypothetical protein
MALNPMGLGVFCEEIIIEKMKENKKSMEKVMEKVMTNEISNDSKLDRLVNVDGSPTSRKILGQHNEAKRHTQIRKLLAIFLMYDLVNAGDFKCIEELYKEIIDKKLNAHITDCINEENYSQIYVNLIKDQFKGKTEIDTKFTIDNVKEYIKYEYFKEPFEGIYINENIMGIIKLLSGMIKERSDSELKEQMKTYKQDTGAADNNTQRNVSRLWLSSSLSKKTWQETGEKKKRKNNDTGKKSENTWMEFMKQKLGINDESDQYSPLYNDEYILNTELVDKQQQVLLNGYKEDKMFNYDKPIIKNILERYTAENANTVFKLFYLFANYKEDNLKYKNCSEQIKLLNTTRTFINSISDYK